MSIDTDVLLTVDTATINQGNKNKKVVFSDNRGDIQPPDNPSDFVSKVDKNMKIKWSGVPKDSSSDDTVEITLVVKKPIGGGVDIMKKPRYEGRNGVVTGMIKNRQVDGEESYDITFTVHKYENDSEVFTIDPKMKMT